MEPFKKRDRFLRCDVLNQLENHPPVATIDDNLIAAEEDAPAVLLGTTPDATFGDRENAPKVTEAEEESKTDAHADLAMSQTGDAKQTKEATEHEAGGGAVKDGKPINETKELIKDGDANLGTFVAVIGDGNESDETKVIEQAGDGGVASDAVDDGEKPDETLVIENAVGEGEKPNATMVIEQAGGGGGASDAVVDEENPDETMENASGDDSAHEAVGCDKQRYKTKEAIGISSNAPDIVDVGGKQTEGNNTEVAPVLPIDDNIRNKQTHPKRKSQEPGDFSPDAENSGHAPRPKRTKNGDAGTDGTGTGSSINIPFVAGNRRFLRLFGTNIPRDQEEHELPATMQPMRRLRLFGVDIIPQDPAVADIRNGSSPTDQESGGHGL